MLTIENKYTQIDDLLDKMAEEIQLDSTRYERMKTSYEAVKNWIEGDELFFHPYRYDVYPHGSVRILTTVKPIGKDEFDLDIVIHLKSTTPHTPQRIYAELKRRIGENEKYRGMMELKNRCIRLNYAGDFHMDILPGIQESEYDQNRIKVPDRELGNWVSSNPRGYAEWFFGQANMVKVSLLEKAFSAEKLPIDNFKNKKPLQRAVQLIKRYRDIYFIKDDTYKTSSIILTTIAGVFYSGEESIFETIDKIITTIRAKVNEPIVRLKIVNPVNPNEDFTDKWDTEPEYYTEFKKFAIHLYNEWQKLKNELGVLEEGDIMKGLFGNETFVKAQTNQTLFLEGLRKQRDLGINRVSGTLTNLGSIGASTIKSNTFYGSTVE
ncbi:MAG: nucleotidyltransferase [Bacteroidales bacterium]|nr:nucleotidyltransferase [Bacteroidales bacterium]